MMRYGPPVFRSVWGIETGMIVATSYGTGPYVITHVLGPHGDGTISLVCVGAPGTPYERMGGEFFINVVRPTAIEGVYSSVGHDTITVTPNPDAPVMQLDLFEEVAA